mmetsp:Transcript_24651/g.48496  ORF Transcript_24651/g.48496 Transcript_24651/m.48496 type:complete len:298 (-) Transcript_24651:187-1080(-)|eukprot:CAMPEP_0175092190 /NCGR_PEP_ID=MMETSP0086_2-20121207/2329_1 /TAXON_ID=136419 /ORGANISM="Unknown Unknown, Strain D1" /LENGTH=297 /DNA_ID=CAMNT_0016365033 /DNA_START=301 /DNA_END=1194 /DNA_ORIENTATION=+
MSAEAKEEPTTVQVVSWEGHEDVAPLKLLTTPTVHFDPENSPNFFGAATNVWQALINSRQTFGISSKQVRVLDLGGGCGVWGLILARTAPKDLDVELVFTDIDPKATEIAALNAKENCPMLISSSFTANMFEGLNPEVKFDLVVFNPPQSGGPAEFGRIRPDKWGGFDGSMYYVRLARECKPFIHDSSVLVVSHIGLANPLRVRYSLETAGGNAFSMSVARWQERQFNRKALDGFVDGLFDHQLRNRAASKAEFTIDGEYGMLFKEGDPRAQVGRMSQEILVFSPIKDHSQPAAFSR